MNIDTRSVRYTLPGVGCSGMVALWSPISTRTGSAISTPGPNLFRDCREGVGEPLVGSKPLQEHEHQHVQQRSAST